MVIWPLISSSVKSGVKSIEILLVNSSRFSNSSSSFKFKSLSRIVNLDFSISLLLKSITAGPVKPKWLINMSPLIDIFFFLSLNEISTSFKASPLRLLSKKSSTLNETSPGLMSVMVWFILEAILYPSPVEPVFGYVMPPVDTTIFDAFKDSLSFSIKNTGSIFSFNSCSISFAPIGQLVCISTSSSSRYSSKISRMSWASSLSGKTLLLSSWWNSRSLSSKMASNLSWGKVYSACFRKFLFLL